MNVLTSLRRVAERQPAKVALSHRGAVLTYAELFDQGARFGAFLRSEGWSLVSGSASTCTTSPNG